MSLTCFTPAEASRVLGLEESRLRYWAQTGFCNPSGRREGRPAYTFFDLVALRAAKGLLDAGFSLQRVRKCVERLRELLPHVDQPLDRLRVFSDGDTILAHGEDQPFEPLSGQLVLDFRTSSIGVVGDSGAEVPPPSARASGYSYLLEGIRCENEGKRAEAEMAYRRATELDPELSGAWNNLAALLADRGSIREARELLERALTLDPDQPEARYNLATLLDESGETDLAIAEYRRVLLGHPNFADAHFNLGVALDRVGGVTQAREHFRLFVELSPDAPESQAVRERLA